MGSLSLHDADPYDLARIQIAHPVGFTLQACSVGSRVFKDELTIVWHCRPTCAAKILPSAPGALLQSARAFRFRHQAFSSTLVAVPLMKCRGRPRDTSDAAPRSCVGRCLLPATRLPRSSPCTRACCLHRAWTPEAVRFVGTQACTRWSGYLTASQHAAGAF